MTSVNVTEISASKKSFKITTPKKRVSEILSEKLEKYKTDADVKGFRKGKVPEQIVKNLFMNDIKKTALEDLVSEGYSEALSKADFAVVGRPKVNVSAPPTEGEDFEFEAAVSVLPELDVKNYKNLSLEISPFLAIEREQKLSDVLVKASYDIAQQIQMESQEKNDSESDIKDRVVKNTGLVYVNLEVKVDGQVDKDLSGEAEKILLGPNLPEVYVTFRNSISPYIQSIIDELQGKKIGETASISYTFSSADKLLHADLIGKTYEITARVVYYSDINPVAIDDELGKKLGYETLDEAKESIATQLDYENRMLKINYCQKQMLDQILADTPLNIDEDLIEMAKAMVAGNQGHHQHTADCKHDHQKELDTALGGIKVAAVVNNILKKEKLEIPQEALNREVVSLSRELGMSAKDFISKFSGNREALDVLNQRARMTTTFGFIFDNAKVAVEGSK